MNKRVVAFLVWIAACILLAFCTRSLDTPEFFGAMAAFIMGAWAFERR
jgi:uncharacterized membrane protein YbhN (UPF0104 family)